jgi:hypothetical protein
MISSASYEVAFKRDLCIPRAPSPPSFRERGGRGDGDFPEKGGLR